MKTRSLLALALVAAPALSMAQEVKGDAGAGGKKIAMCIGCHGIAGLPVELPEVYKVPKIAGQNAKYIVAALNGYKSGDRKHPTMRGIAGSLSDQDMADVAAYYEALGKDRRCRRDARDAAAPSRRLLKARAACKRATARTSTTPIDPANPRDGRPTRRLPAGRAEGVQDRQQPAGRPHERGHEGHARPRSTARRSPSSATPS